MIASKRFIGILILVAVMMAGGCSNLKTKPLPSIPGTDTSSVTLFVNSEDGSALLTGQVRKKTDARIIENYVREEYGFTKISNQITYN